jgi:glycosyltransferase involved in cell wall biosynthesis
MTIHDLQHRLQPEFPEVSADGEWERREYLFRNSVRRAEAVIVDSEIGREDVLNCYGSEVAPDRIEILPYVPAPYLVRAPDAEVAQIRDRFGLEDRYLLFPAQFWPHKNHVRLIEAVQLLRDSGRAVIQVVMTGSATSPIMHQVESQIRASILDKQLDQQFVLTGRLSDSEMAAVYSGTDGVVLPTFFGPTNIPVVEAWALGIPVLTSDIRGITEQCGDAAILVDPSSAASIADGLQTIWTDRAARSDLAKAGLAKIASYGPQDFAQRFDAILKRVEGRLASR